MDLWGLESLGRATMISPFSCDTLMSLLTFWESVPLGPFTVTRLSSSTVTVTPAGTGIGSLPIRDIFLHLHYHT